MTALDKATKAMEARCPHGPFNGSSCAFCRGLARVALEAAVEDVAERLYNYDIDDARIEARHILGLDGGQKAAVTKPRMSDG